MPESNINMAETVELPQLELKTMSSNRKSGQDARTEGKCKQKYRSIKKK
jgi:hypothetical protein